MNRKSSNNLQGPIVPVNNSDTLLGFDEPDEEEECYEEEEYHELNFEE